jgi:hypothetical protein
MKINPVVSIVNLFTLVALCACAVAIAFADEPFSRPGVIRWGASAAEMQQTLSAGKLCTTMKTRPIVPPFLDHVKQAQVQIDCDGFPFMGKPRWAEFVIGDDSLEMVWIMTTKEEEQALARAMQAAYGEPTHRNSLYSAFAKNGAALRFKPAEVLFYSDRLREEAEGWFR